MGRPKPIKRQKARNAEYYDMQRTQDDLYKRSLDKQNFVKLMDIIQCDKNIMLAYRNIKRNGGSQTPGTIMYNNSRKCRRNPERTAGKGGGVADAGGPL